MQNVSDYIELITALVDVHENKVIGIERVEKFSSVEIQRSMISDDDAIFIRSFTGELIEFDPQNHSLIEFILMTKRNIPNTTVEKIISKVFEGFPVQNLELIHKIKFITDGYTVEKEEKEL